MFRICQCLCPFIAWLSVPLLCVSKGLCMHPAFMCDLTGQLSAFCSSPAQTVFTVVEFGVGLGYKVLVSMYYRLFYF